MSLPTGAYKPAIDGLRAIAVLSVIIFHVDFLDLLPGGFTGVDLFFVISGYVISQSLWERRNLTFGRYLADFYRRHLLRIMPALLTVLCVSFVLCAMFMPPFWLSELINRTGLAAFFGLSNLVLAWTTGLELLAVQLLYPLLVFALAAASYHWVETPIRSGKSAVQRSARLTFITGVSITGLMWLGAHWVSENPSTLSLSQTRDSYTWYAYKHYPQEDFTTLDDPNLAGRQLFVIGDSHTAAYRTLLKLVSLKLGITVVEYEQGGCSVVSLIGADPARCAQVREAQLQEIEARAKPGDMVFLASLRMPELAGRNWREGEAIIVDEALSELTAEHQQAAQMAARSVRPTTPTPSRCSSTPTTSVGMATAYLSPRLPPLC